MAQTPNFTPDVEAAAERIKQTSERGGVEQREWPHLVGRVRENVERRAQAEEDTAKEVVRTG